MWLDLLEPTLEEERQVEQALGIDVPTREEMREIETSNRLYEENGALYMTSTVVWKVDTALPETTQVTFILTGARLVTNRYADLLSFKSFVGYAQNHPAVCTLALAAADRPAGGDRQPHRRRARAGRRRHRCDLAAGVPARTRRRAPSRTTTRANCRPSARAAS